MLLVPDWAMLKAVVFSQGAAQSARAELSQQPDDASVLAAARDALQREMGELKDRISGANRSTTLRIAFCHLPR